MTKELVLCAVVCTVMFLVSFAFLATALEKNTIDYRRGVFDGLTFLLVPAFITALLVYVWLHPGEL